MLHFPRRGARHVIHHAGAIVADQLGPGKLRGVPPEWGAFASLAALVATALAPVYRQVQPLLLPAHACLCGVARHTALQRAPAVVRVVAEAAPALRLHVRAGNQAGSRRHTRVGLTGASMLCVVTGGKLCALMRLGDAWAQVGRTRAASGLLPGGASSLLAPGAPPQHPGQQPGGPADSRIAGVSTLFPPPEAAGDAADWDFVAR